MLSKKMERCLSFLMAVIMVLSLMPVSALAAEEETHDHTHETVEPAANENEESAAAETTVPAEESNPVIEDIQYDMDSILDWYIGTSDATAEEVPALCALMDEMSLNDAAREIIGLVGDLEYALDDGLVTESQVQALAERNPDFMAFNDYVMSNATNGYNASVLAETGSHTPVTGVTVGVSGATDNSMSSGAVTVTAKGNGGVWGIGASAKTATITITNDSGSKATVSFDWKATSVNELKIDGTQYTGSSGTFSKQMDAGDNFTITITTAKNGTENKLVMSNFAVVAAQASSNITVQFDSAVTSVTVGKTSIASGDVIAVDGEVGATFSTSGTNFVAWVDSNNNIVGTTASFVYKPSQDATIRPVHTTNACFTIGGFSTAGKLFNDLTAANTAAVNGADKKIVLHNNGILPAGEYTISSGITLLIPRDAAATVNTSRPEAASGGSASYKPTFFRTLTMASGAKITVSGAVCVGGSYSTKQGYNGMPYGDLGRISMNSNSALVFNSGSNFYAWGYITGSGTVTMNSGATVHEDMQIRDWRGGTITSKMLGNSQKIFPISQYYVQNVEVPMTLVAGAIEKIYSAVSISIVGDQYFDPTFIGNSSTDKAMFILNSGSLTKRYDSATDRLVIDLNNATVEMKNITMTLKLSVFGEKTIDSTSYTLPLNSNITVNANSGTNVTITQDIALLPGSELNIHEGANAVLGSDSVIYIYDGDNWGGYCSASNYKIMPVIYSPTKSKTRTEADLTDAIVLVNGTVDASAGSVYTTEGKAKIYSTGNGIIKTKTVSNGKTYQATQSGSDSWAAKEIATIAPQLFNRDGTYALTGNSSATTNTYTYTDGYWRCATHSMADDKCSVCGYENNCVHSYTSEVTKPASCKEAGVTTYTCTLCGKTYTEEIPMLTTHTPKADDGDCTTEVTCSVCGAVTTAANATHTGGTATCTEQAVCSVCSKPYGTKLNHSMTEHPAQAATCVKTGNYAYWDCSTCDPMYKDANGSEAYADNGWIIPKDLENGHAWSVTYSFADDGSACTATHVCGNDASHNVTIHATITPEVIKAPNCTEKGTTKYTATFAEDWAVAQTKEVEVAALGHTFINEVEFKEPTCTEDGNQAYKQCETCDLYFADNAQKYDEGGQEDNSSFTISSRGGHDYSTQAFDTTHHWIECSVCGEPNETTMVEHSFTSKASDKEASAATCTANQFVYVQCDNCDAVSETETFEVAGTKLDHTFNEKASNKEASAATCTANQFVYVQCDNCEAVSGSLTVEVADTKLGHNWTDATCAAPKTCSVCGETEGTATGEHLDANSDNKCDDCGAAITAYQIESYASSLLMKGMIHVKQYWKFIGLTEEQVKSGNAYMKVTEVDGDTYTVDLEWYKNDYANGMTIFSAPSNGIPAKNLGENLSMQAFVEVDGVVYESAIRDYGVLTYAENMMKKDNEALKSALVALLNYGAAAQIDLGYKTDDLANKDLQRYVDEFGLNPAYLDLGWTDDYLTSVVEPSEAMTVNFAPTGTVTSAAKSLYLKGAISVNYYVTVGKDKTKFANSTATMYFWTAEQYAKLAKAGTALTKENASYFVTNDKLAYNSNAKLQYYYTFLSDQIPAKNFGDTIYAVMCVTDSDGVEHCSEMILYSPEVYAANKINNGKVETVDDVAKWMVVYGERAKLALA